MRSRLFPLHVEVYFILGILSVGAGFAFLVPLLGDNEAKFQCNGYQAGLMPSYSFTSSHVYTGIHYKKKMKMKSSHSDDGTSTTDNKKHNQNINVDIDLIRKTADLSQLDLTDEECEKLTTRVKDFLQFVDAMRTVEIKNKKTEDRIHTNAYSEVVAMENIVRVNEIQVCKNQDAIIENMPIEEDGYLRIPKVGEESTT